MNVIQNINKIINRQDFFSYLIGLFLSTILIGYAPSSILFGALVFFTIYHLIVNKVKIKLSLMLILPIILYLYFCLTYVWSVDKELTIKGLFRTISLLIIPIVFSIIPRFTRKNYNIVLNIFTASNILLGTFFLITSGFNFFKTNSLSVFTYHDLVSVLDLNAIYVSVFFSLSFFYLLSLKNKTLYQKGGTVFLGVLLILLSSKTVIIASVFCFAIFFLRKKEKIKHYNNPRRLIMMFLILTVLSLASIQVVNRFKIEFDTNLEEVLTREKFNRVYPWTGTSFRLLQLRILKKQIEEDNIFLKGFGLFGSRADLIKKHLEFNTYYGYHTKNYHNMYAQIFSETGIIGLILLLLMLARSFIQAFKTQEVLILSFSVIIFFLFFTESFLWVQRGVYLTIILYCLFSRINFDIKQ